jgi:hypothetical protein
MVAGSSSTISNQISTFHTISHCVRVRACVLVRVTHVDIVFPSKPSSYKRHYATSRKVASSIPDEVIGFFSLYLNLAAALLPWDWFSLWQKWVPGIFLAGKAWPPRKRDNLTAICEPVVQKMWDPWRLTTLLASTACYRGSFIFYLYQNHMEFWITCIMYMYTCLGYLPPQSTVIGVVWKVNIHYIISLRSGGPGSIPGTTRKKKCSGSGTGCTQPREYKLRSYLIEK